jgi:tRNA threonylcarbamoyladenosine biosynthesis protein TsaB
LPFDTLKTRSRKLLITEKTSLLPLILYIETSTENASVALARDTEVLNIFSNPEQKSHASWIHLAIKELVASCGHSVSDLDAVGATFGPGSYTGLRVGLATAKGLCYALQIPMVTVNTLEAMASAATNEEAAYLCPMIDARRMDVFTALYNKALQPVFAPAPVTLTPDLFKELLKEKSILFFGNGAKKFQTLSTSVNSVFKDIPFDASVLPRIIINKYNIGDFADLTYAEPEYLKEFYRHPSNK